MLMKNGQKSKQTELLIIIIIIYCNTQDSRTSANNHLCTMPAQGIMQFTAKVAYHANNSWTQVHNKTIIYSNSTYEDYPTLGNWPL